MSRALPFGSQKAETTFVILGDIIAANAALFPNKLGVADEIGCLSFAELASRAKRLANALAARGVRRGDCVAVIAHNCCEYVEVLGAGEMAGFVMAPIDVRMTREALKAVLSNCRPAAVIFDHAFKPLMSLVPALGCVKAAICIDGRADEAEDYESVLAASSDLSPRLRAQPDDAALIIHADSNAGYPKAVMQSHHDQIRSALAFCTRGEVDQDDRVLIAKPLFHASGRCMQIGHHLRSCTVFLQRRFDAGVLLETIERRRITAAFISAKMIQAALDHPDAAWRDLTSLRTVYYSGSLRLPAMRMPAAAAPMLIQYPGGIEPERAGLSLAKQWLH